MTTAYAAKSPAGIPSWPPGSTRKLAGVQRASARSAATGYTTGPRSSRLRLAISPAMDGTPR